MTTHPATKEAYTTEKIVFPELRGFLDQRCARCGGPALKWVKLYEKPANLAYKFCWKCSISYHHFLRGEEVKAIKLDDPHGEFEEPEMATHRDQERELDTKAAAADAWLSEIKGNPLGYPS